MENKAIYILKTFSKKDIKSFESFLYSPFYNQSKKLIKLYNALIKFHPSFNSKFLSEKRLSKKISPDLEFNRYTLNRLFFDLYHCEEKYLLIKSLEDNPRSQDLLRGEFFKRKLYKLIEKNIYLGKKNLESNKDLNADYYLNMFNLYTDIHNLATITSSKSNKLRIKNNFDTLTKRGMYLTYFFVTEIIREYENLLTHNKTFNNDTNLNFINEIFTKFDFPELLKVLIHNAGNSTYSNILHIYLALLLTFSNLDKEKYYFNYKKVFLANINNLSIDEKRFHFGRLIRYCMMKREVSESYNKFNYELFNVYEFILKNENYKSAIMNYIPVELYRSILLQALRLKKYTWTIEFIKKYSKLINPSRRKNIYHFSMAEYYFQRKMYKDSRHNLHKIIFDEFVYKLDYKNLMLITNFELKEFDSALDLIESYKRFLSKDKTLSASSKKRHKNFINIVQNLIHYKTSANKISTYHIEKVFDYDMPYSNWVKDKMLELDIKLRKAI